MHFDVRYVDLNISVLQDKDATRRQMLGAGPYTGGIVYNNRAVCAHRYQQLGRSVELKYNSYYHQVHVVPLKSPELWAPGDGGVAFKFHLGVFSPISGAPSSTLRPTPWGVKRSFHSP